MGRQSHAEKRRRDEGFIHGMKKHPNIIAIMGSLDGEAVLEIVERHLAALDAKEKARAHYLQCVRREAQVERRLMQISGIIRERIYSAHHAQPDVLMDFGLVTRKRTGPKTPEAIEKGIAKAKATRIARHTLGKRQREKIKGDA
jgi:4-hydroxy-3-methylbut-2-enyl diphosphate reductase IspH